MLSLTRISIFLLLILALQQTIGTKNIKREYEVNRMDFNIKKAIRIGKILGKLSAYSKQAINLWQTIEQLHDVFAVTPRFKEIDTDERLIMLNSKIDKISADVKSFKDRLFRKLEDKFDRKSLEEKMERLVKEMININENYYLKFLEYTNSNATHQEFYILQLVEDAVGADAGLEKSLIQIKTDLLDKTVNYKNVLYFLADQQLVNELMCPRQQSAQRSIHILYEQVLLTEVRAYLMLLFSINVINEVYEQDRNVNVIEHNFVKRIGMIYSEVKEAMKGTSREVWRCDHQFIEDQTYSRLRPIFQQYVLHESEAYEGNAKKRNDLGCHEDCPSITNKRHRSCLYDLCTHAYRKACYGILRDCQFKHALMTVCSSDDSAYRRYEYIKTGDGNIYGVENTCPRNESTGENRLLVDINFNVYWCDYCLCTCDTSTTHPSESVYINLRSVLSDIDNNRVITGVQISNGEMIHLQIREGELIPNGRIDPSTVKFQPIKHYSVQNESYLMDSDYMQITWEKRTICLDDLDSPEIDKVLTGIKFELHENKVQLAIRLTSFDFYTGKLIPNDSKWISHTNLSTAPRRSSLSMKNLDVPKGNDINEPRSTVGQCIEFHTSGLKQDAGQNIVPFIDIQPLINNPPTPLSGAGLFLRGSDDTGGFLAPKIFTFNIEPYMHQPNGTSVSIKELQCIRIHCIIERSDTKLKCLMLQLR